MVFSEIHFEPKQCHNFSYQLITLYDPLNKSFERTMLLVVVVVGLIVLSKIWLTFLKMFKIFSYKTTRPVVELDPDEDRLYKASHKL